MIPLLDETSWFLSPFYVEKYYQNPFPEYKLKSGICDMYSMKNFELSTKGKKWNKKNKQMIFRARGWFVDLANIFYGIKKIIFWYQIEKW